MLDYSVIDNFLPSDEFEKLSKLMPGTYDFPWFYNPFIATRDPNEFGFQFTHLFYSNEYGGITSEYFNNMLALINKMEAKQIHKIKANLSGRTPTHEEGGWHVDNAVDRPCRTAILYLNTNNGYTKFEDGTIVESVANRYVEFDSTIPHTSVSHTDQKIRCLINFNFDK
jgi:hypothetical protein